MMKLYRFEYSCYARKVQMVLDLLGLDYRIVEVPYTDREELARLTQGHIQVPVLQLASGEAIVDSRKICEWLLNQKQRIELAPAPRQGPIWAYADWCDGPFEDVMFRIATPIVRERFFTTPAARGLFTFIKERKFGSGCVEEWARNKESLVTRVRQMLVPTLQTLAHQPFLVGERPTLADAALYGQFAMLQVADPALPGYVAAAIPAWMQRVEAAAT